MYQMSMEIVAIKMMKKNVIDESVETKTSRNEDMQSAENAFTERYRNMHSLWNEQLNLFLQHMTSPGNNSASYFFVYVHVSADSINLVEAAAVA